MTIAAITIYTVIVFIVGVAWDSGMMSIFYERVIGRQVKDVGRGPWTRRIEEVTR